MPSSTVTLLDPATRAPVEAHAPPLPVTRAQFDQWMVPCYAPASFVPVRGLASRVWDQQGRMYIDFASGVAVTSLGHCHPAIVKALTDQAHALWHVSNWMTNEPALRLAKKIIDATFAERVFLCNSGAEANEAGLKLARRYAHDHYGPEKFRVISTLNAFHGRTLFTVTAGGQAKYSTGFGPPPTGFTHIRYNDIAGLEAAFAEEGGDDVCAVILEPMQGEGGMIPGTPDFLAAARRLCDEHDALLVFDEIQSGMGRTGALYSYMQKGVVPDILTSAKGLGGGFPIGALLTSTEIASAFSVGVHGSTFGGNPLACAVAGAVFDIVNTVEVLDGVRARHALFMEGLRTINQRREVFADIRGEGVWLGCELAEPWRGKAPDVMRAAGDAGLLVLMAGPDVVRIAPSLIISLDEILEGLSRLEAALGKALA
ncbi:MAG TPA: acetylornithine/succinyldiaminopimelate transaminase [Casimicrobiaceae bacterium]|jgi:acetylornithine/N-succinyldiaminopimelate aminotransferase|nr:acetylornithine/succinyldiaminopimelate transaminase [Casimicrobiaceae bacterium]